MAADNPRFPPPEPLDDDYSIITEENKQFWKNAYLAAIQAGVSLRDIQDYADQAVDDLNKYRKHESES